jgi:sulfate adenylyltransferase
MKAPYIAAREAARKLVENNGGFIEVYVSTPISVCEERDTKGLYAKARKGLLKGFTGIDDPYESPLQPEINIDTSKMTIKEEIEFIVQFLIDQGYLKS